MKLVLSDFLKQMNPGFVKWKASYSYNQMCAVQVRWKSVCVAFISFTGSFSPGNPNTKGQSGAYRDITRSAGQAMTSTIELNLSMPFPALIHARNYGIYFQIFKAVYQAVQMPGCVAAFCLSAHRIWEHKRAGH